jgi:hypothetical protein
VDRTQLRGSIEDALNDIKRRGDLDNVLRLNQNIPPADAPPV